MKVLLLLVIALMFAPEGVQAQAGPEMAWSQDYQLALEQAVITRRPLMVTFATSWCGWCRKLEGNTFRDPAFQEAARAYIPVKLDGDRERSLVSLFRVTSYPTTVLLNRQGREIGRLVGYEGPSKYIGFVNAGLSHREPFRQLQQEAELRPGDANAAYALGDALLALSHYEQARAEFDRVVELDPQDALGLADDVVLDAGIAMLLSRDYGGAVAELEGFLGSHPESGRRDEGLFFLGLALIGQGRLQDAVDRLEAAAEVTRSDYIRREARKLASSDVLQG